MPGFWTHICKLLQESSLCQVCTESAECKKSPDTPTKYCNCSGDHPASYSQCSDYLKYLEKRTHTITPRSADISLISPDKNLRAKVNSNSLRKIVPIVTVSTAIYLNLSFNLNK